MDIHAIAIARETAASSKKLGFSLVVYESWMIHTVCLLYLVIASYSKITKKNCNCRLVERKKTNNERKKERPLFLVA